MAERPLDTSWKDSCSRMGAGAYYYYQLAGLTATGTETFHAPVKGKVSGILVTGVDAHTGSNYVTVVTVNKSNSDAVMTSAVTTSGGTTANQGAAFLNTKSDGDELMDLGDVIEVTSTESGTLANATYITVVFESID